MQFAPSLLNRIAAFWNADLQSHLRAYDLTTAKMRTLAVLTIYPQLTINELATLTVMEQSTMSRTLDALDAADMIQRVARKDDLRVRDVMITDAGRAAFNAFWPTMHGRFCQMFEGVDEREYRQLIATLQKLLRNQTRAELDGGG